MKISPKTSRGHVLVSTLVIVGLAGIMLASNLALVGRQNYLTTRSQAWASAVVLAEAGIEEAMAHLNTLPTNRAANGWALSTNGHTKIRTIGDGYFYAVISTAKPPTIVSIGFAKIPLQTNSITRTVMATTKSQPAGHAILAKSTIMMDGAVVDSFNSSDPAYSTGGKYDAAKRNDEATLATTSSAQPAIDVGSGKVYGSVSVGPNGTATIASGGGVGDGEWLADNSGSIQDGHFSDGLEKSISDVSVPFTLGYTIPSSGKINGVKYKYIVDAGKNLLLSCSLSGGNDMIVTGDATLYVVGSFSSTGTIYISPGASLKLYIGGPNAKFGGNGVVNETQDASKCAIYGLPTLTSITFSGGGEYTGTLYAPQADFTMSGTPDLYGSIVANSVLIKGGTGFHYDEALGTPNGAANTYRIASWEEL